MKYYPYLFAAFLCISANLPAQDCCVPPLLHDLYERDVKHLALLRMEYLHAPALNFIEIDQAWQDTIWEGLAAIYHSGSAGREAIFNEQCIHHNIWTTADYQRIASSLYVRLDTSAPWYQNWVNGNITTNNALMDSLLHKYGFETVNYSFPFIQAFRLSTDQKLNLKPLADSLEALSDKIVYAEKTNAAGGNMRIVYQRLPGQRYYDFYIGWGDCPSGCIYWHKWSFVVDDACHTNYLGSFGNADIPPPANCNVFSNSITEITLMGDFEICQGSNTILTASGGSHYLWNTGDSTASITVSPVSETGYTVTVTVADGCTYEKTVAVAVNPLPPVFFQLSRDTFCIDETSIELSGGFPAGGNYSGPGVANNLFTPSLAGVGNHLLSYTYQDATGCSNTASEMIVVEAGSCISKLNTSLLPAFVKMSPNPASGDIIVTLTGFHGSMTVQVYDTRNRLVYETHGDSNQINISGLPKGIYLVKASNARSVAGGRLIVE